MSQERISYLDRKISKLRDDQEGLMQEWDELETIIIQYEKEADRLEGLVNDEKYGGTCNDEE